MKRRIGQAIVFVMAFLILVAEVQRADDAAERRAMHELNGTRP